MTELTVRRLNPVHRAASPTLPGPLQVGAWLQRELQWNTEVTRAKEVAHG